METCVISSNTTLPFIKVFTLNQKASENSKFSTFNRSNLFHDQSKKNEEIHHNSIPIRSVKKNIRSIEKDSQLIETMKNFIIEFQPKSTGSRFLFD